MFYLPVTTIIGFQFNDIWTFASHLHRENHLITIMSSKIYKMPISYYMWGLKNHFIKYFTLLEKTDGERVLKCHVRWTLAIKGFKILFTEPIKIPHGVHNNDERTFNKIVWNTFTGQRKNPFATFFLLKMFPKFPQRKDN